MTKRWSNDEEMLMALKKEIIRLGIQDNPSRTKYQENYDRTIAPSPNSVMMRLDKKWVDAIKLIGLKYDKSDMIKERGKKGGEKGGRASKKGTGTGKSHTIPKKQWNSKTDEEFLAAVIKEFKRGGFRSLNDYGYAHKKGIAPSVYAIKKRFGWETVSVVEENLSKYLDWELGAKHHPSINK